MTNNENHLVGYNQGCTEKRLKMYTRDLNVWVRNYFGRKYFGLLTKESNIDLICGLKNNLLATENGLEGKEARTKISQLV